MQLLDYDPHSGMETWWAYDPGDDTTHIIRQQRIEGLLAANRAIANAGGWRSDWSWHAARLPAIVIEKWRQELGVNVFDKNHWPAVRRLLNSNEWRWLRTAEFNL